MGPAARVRLGWAVAVVPWTDGVQWTVGIVDTEAVVNVGVLNELVFIEGFAFIVIRMMVMMMMMIGTGHHGCRMAECNVLAWEWFCGARCVRVRACVSVPVIGRSGAEGTAMRKRTVARTGRGASSSQSSATVMAASASASAAATAAMSTATPAAAGVATSAAAAGAC